MNDGEQVMIPYTEMFDQFTVFFYENHIFISGHERPIGERTVDILNMDESILDQIDDLVWEFIPAARAMLTTRTDDAVAFAQRKLNALWDVIFTLPVYREMNIDYEVSYNLFFRFRADPEKWAQTLDPTSKGSAMFELMYTTLACFTSSIRSFRKSVIGITERYLEPLKRRSGSDYAEAYAQFYAEMLYVSARVLNEDFELNIPMEVNFVPMQHPTEKGKIFIAEKATFNSLTDFLKVEFYRGLAAGNVPRCCHNCGRYFLLTEGYNICYCNNIAPGETDRTCRTVGAHRKEAQGRANWTPAQKEYKKTYSRLNGRKKRHKISTDEWNAAVAQAQELVARSKRGELTDDELTRLLAEL